MGTCGLTALLITSDQGHVVIDGASAAAGPLIAANIRALGFDPAQVRYLLNRDVPLPVVCAGLTATAQSASSKDPTKTGS